MKRKVGKEAKEGIDHASKPHKRVGGGGAGESNYFYFKKDAEIQLMLLKGGKEDK